MRYSIWRRPKDQGLRLRRCENCSSRRSHRDRNIGRAGCPAFRVSTCMVGPTCPPGADRLNLHIYVARPAPVAAVQLHTDEPRIGSSRSPSAISESFRNSQDVLARSWRRAAVCWDAPSQEGHMKKIVLILVVTACPLAAQTQPPSQPATKVDYDKDVRPILSQHCYSCH